MKLFITVLLHVVGFLTSTRLFAANDTTFVLWHDIQSTGRDFSSIATSIASFSANDGMYVLYGSGVIASVVAADVLTRFDDDARTALQRQRSSQNDGVMRLADAYGETKYALAAGGLLYIGGIAIGEERVRTTGRLAFESLLVSGVITTSLKYVLGRARPFLDEGQGSFTPFPGLRNDSRFSLPSGHTTVAFTLSTVLAKRINNTYASIGLYSAAGLTGLARMYYDKHWLTDVLAGAAVGYLSATWILNIHESNSVQSQAQSQSSFRCFLSPTPGGVSFTAIW